MRSSNVATTPSRREPSGVRPWHPRPLLVGAVGLVVTLPLAVAAPNKEKDGKEDAPVDEKSPLWMEIRVLGADGKPARELPLKDGSFEVTLPRALFADSPKQITLSWIDFYRN